MLSFEHTPCRNAVKYNYVYIMAAEAATQNENKSLILLFSVYSFKLYAGNITVQIIIYIYTNTHTLHFAIWYFVLVSVIRIPQLAALTFGSFDGGLRPFVHRFYIHDKIIVENVIIPTFHCFKCMNTMRTSKFLWFGFYFAHKRNYKKHLTLCVCVCVCLGLPGFYSIINISRILWLCTFRINLNISEKKYIYTKKSAATKIHLVNHIFRLICIQLAVVVVVVWAVPKISMLGQLLLAYIIHPQVIIAWFYSIDVCLFFSLGTVSYLNKYSQSALIVRRLLLFFASNSDFIFDSTLKKNFSEDYY